MGTYYKFNDLTNSQKQIIAEKWCNDVAHFNCQNIVVEYILNQHDDDAPFNYDDITNNQPTGQIEINGKWRDIDQEECNELLEFYVYLANKWDDYLGTLNANMDDEYLVELRIDEDDYQLTIANAEVNKERLKAIAERLENLELDDYPEIMQWFSCSEYAVRKLDEAGQCILNGEYWGRQCYGQAIYLDCCIQQIAFDYYCMYGQDYITDDTIEYEKFNVSQYWHLAS